jgi:hypothetical protein
VQDKYVADIGDFGKYALLKHLRRERASRLGVVWYWVDPDHTDSEHQKNDGKHINYLGVNGNKPDLNLQRLDQNLFDQLRSLVTRDERRTQCVETYALIGNDTVFFSDSVSAATVGKKRNKWLSNALETVSHADIVFLDPDNGLASRERNGTKAKDAKYVLRDELIDFWGTGTRALVLYHHPDRSTDHDTQILALTKELESFLPNSRVFPLRYRRGTSRVYFVIVPASLAAGWIDHLKSFATLWSDHFEFDKYLATRYIQNVLP